MSEQVFTTITSASAAWGVISAPASASIPIMTSLSTRFLGQPRLTKPILSRAVLLEISSSRSVPVFALSSMQFFYSSIPNGRGLGPRFRESRRPRQLQGLDFFVQLGQAVRVVGRCAEAGPFVMRREARHRIL